MIMGTSSVLGFHTGILTPGSAPSSFTSNPSCAQIGHSVTDAGSHIGCTGCSWEGGVSEVFNVRHFVAHAHHRPGEDCLLAPDVRDTTGKISCI